MEALAMTERSFWENKNVFLTGHTGFKGSWLSLWLQSLGAKVTGYALEPSTNPSLFVAANVAEGMTSIIGDVRDGENLAAVMRRAEPDIVIHMAAQPLVRYSYENPVETYSTNVMGTVNLLEAVRQTTSVRAVVNVTSDKCYENREWVWSYRENEAMGGYDPYSNSKGCSELVTAAYRSSFFNPAGYATHGVALASARAGNVIGGGDWSQDRLIPDIIRSVAGGKPVLVRNPHAIRPWQHVLEPLKGYLLLAQTLYSSGGKFAEGWNFGPDESDARPVQWIVENLTNRWGENASWALDSKPGPHEATYLKLDSSKARNLLSWKPTWSLDTALDRICTWHKAHLSKGNMRQMTIQQIQEFENTAQGAAKI